MTKKKLLFIGFSIFLLILLVGFLFFRFYVHTNSYRVFYVEKNTGLSLPKPTSISYQNTHGGFHGDGETLIRLHFHEKDTLNILSQIAIDENWNSFPLSENLSLMFYGGEKDGVTYSYNLAKEFELPMVENGYWYFKNRSKQAQEKQKDTELFAFYSYNFTTAFFDKTTNTLYYFEYDT